MIAEDAEDRRAHSDHAVEAARQLGDDGLLAEVLSARLYVLWAPETAEERLATSTQIIELGVRTGDVRRELDGHMRRLIALLEFGRVAEAEAELGRYERLAERLGQPEFLFFARSRRSTPAALRGRFDEAERLARAAYDLVVKAGLPDAVNVLGAQLGAIATARGGSCSTRSWSCRQTGSRRCCSRPTARSSLAGGRRPVPLFRPGCRGSTAAGSRGQAEGSTSRWSPRWPTS